MDAKLPKRVLSEDDVMRLSLILSRSTMPRESWDDLLEWVRETRLRQQALDEVLAGHLLPQVLLGQMNSRPARPSPTPESPLAALCHAVRAAQELAGDPANTEGGARV